MNTKIGVILAAVMATGAAFEMRADTPATNPPAARSSRAATAPRQPATRNRAARPAPAPVSSAPLPTNEVAVARQNNVNVRGQARINSEVVARLKQGEEVFVMEEVTLAKPKVDEPAKWVKIALPAGSHVWVNSSFLDAGSTVKATKLNLRGGPGENYSILGVLQKGDTVKAVSTKGDWTEIEAPTNSYAFVASHLLAARTVVAAPPEPVLPVTPIVAVPPPVTDPGTSNAAVTPVVPTPLPAPVEPPPPAKRIVQREGIVGDTVSIQAPTYYQLESLDTGRAINYLYTTSTNLVLSRYKGLTVLVSGEEALDERWPNTPVLTIQRIQVVK